MTARIISQWHKSLTAGVFLDTHMASKKLNMWNMYGLKLIIY